MSDIVNAGMLRASTLTLDEQEHGLAYFLNLMKWVRGSTTRDVNRGVYLGAKMLGVEFKRLQRMMKIAAINGVAAAIRDCPNEVKYLFGEGYVYFAAAACGEKIKIGFSATPTVRLEALSRVTGMELTEIARFAGYMLNEHCCHVVARSAWLGGEWYDADLLLVQPHFRFLNKTAWAIARKSRAA